MTPKRIVFYTFGLLGDIHPFLALGREMRRRGHSPVISTTPVYRTVIEGEGVEFHPVRPQIDVTDPEILRRVMDRRTEERYIISDILLPVRAGEQLPPP
jgi:rhamnosyltransferase subunit B